MASRSTATLHGNSGGGYEALRAAAVEYAKLPSIGRLFRFTAESTFSVLSLQFTASHEHGSSLTAPNLYSSDGRLSRAIIANLIDGTSLEAQRPAFSRGHFIGPEVGLSISQLTDFCFSADRYGRDK